MEYTYGYIYEFECGCKVNDDELDYCPKHAAVDALLEAAEYAMDKLTNMTMHDVDELEIAEKILAKLNAAIAKAKGE